MPASILDAAERERLQTYPREVPEEDLLGSLALSEADRREVAHQRGVGNRLGFALQLCALRYLGFFPDGLSRFPTAAIVYVARELGIEPELEAMADASRPNTSTNRGPGVRRGWPTR